MGVGVENAYLTDNLERIKAEGGGKRPELQYNEFIVYDTKQIMAKYVVVADDAFCGARLLTHGGMGASAHEPG